MKEKETKYYRITNDGRYVCKLCFGLGIWDFPNKKEFDEHFEKEHKKLKEDKKLQNNKKWTAIIMILVLVVSVSIVYFTNRGPTISAQDARFIGNNSILYTQLGCSHCIDQEKMFGDKYKYLNAIDCFYDMDKCIMANISTTPTWVINGKYYEGIKTVEELKDLINKK